MGDYMPCYKEALKYNGSNPRIFQRTRKNWNSGEL